MQGRFAVPGCLQNFNTENSFKGLDKGEALKQVPPTQCQYEKLRYNHRPLTI